MNSTLTKPHLQDFIRAHTPKGKPFSHVLKKWMDNNDLQSILDFSDYPNALEALNTTPLHWASLETT